MNPENFVYFVRIDNKNNKFKFTSYRDKEGNEHFIEGKLIRSKDGSSEPSHRTFSFSPAQRTIRLPLNAKKEIEFLRNSPWCQDSPNQNNRSPIYKEINQVKDAQYSVSAKKRKNEAENLVLSLDLDKLTELAALLGKSGGFSGKNDEDIQTGLLFYVLEIAGHDPEKIFSAMEDPHIVNRALVKRCVASGLFEKKGNLLTWKQTEIGVDEDDAIANITKNPGLKRSITAALKKVEK